VERFLKNFPLHFADMRMGVLSFSDIRMTDPFLNIFQLLPTKCADNGHTIFNSSIDVMAAYKDAIVERIPNG